MLKQDIERVARGLILVATESSRLLVSLLNNRRINVTCPKNPRISLTHSTNYFTLILLSQAADVKRQSAVVTHTRDLLNRAPEIIKTVSANISSSSSSLLTSSNVARSENSSSSGEEGGRKNREITGSMTGAEGVSFPSLRNKSSESETVSEIAKAAGISAPQTATAHSTPVSIKSPVTPTVAPISTQTPSPSSASTPRQSAVSKSASESNQSSPQVTSTYNNAVTSSSKASPKRTFREVAVPSSQLQRVWGFGSLAAKLLIGAAGERVSKLVNGSGVVPSAEKISSIETAAPSSQSASIQSPSVSSFDPSKRKANIPNVKPAINISEAQAERLAEGLCRMRGAALKIGQMLSLSDETMIPPQIAKALERVRTQADVMPKRQFEKVMTNEFGSDWREKFGGDNFEDLPVAAASIGQVHRTVLPDGRMCAVKVQYPGVAESITSDINNLKTLLSIGNFLPAGLYIDSVMAVAREELAAECDYLREAAAQERFRANVGADPDFEVAEVVRSHSTARVLTTTWVKGMPIDQVSVTERGLPQSVRDGVARKLLKLTLNELFTWRFMQTDPNWGNFLYDPEKDVIGLLDFGASRHFKKAFVDDYLRLVWAAANKDTKTITDISIRLGFLTGLESKAMLHAHVESGLVVGEPFLTNEPFDFHGSGITQRVSQYGEVFAHERLTPPPTEVYSLHRKLAGAFLICIRMGAKMKCRDLLEEVYFNHKFGPVSDEDDKSGLAIAAVKS